MSRASWYPWLVLAGVAGHLLLRQSDSEALRAGVEGYLATLKRQASDIKVTLKPH